jgi:hypothetical protein
MPMTFSVKNFEQFQHYKDRAPPWIKLYNALLDDYRFACLQDASKLHLILIWLLASRSDNKLPYDSAWVGQRISANSPVDLDALVEAGFILIDQPLQGLAQDASTMLAKRLPRERERGRDRERKEYPSSDDGFDAFWQAYPRKTAKGSARGAFRKALTKSTLPSILAALERQKPQWSDPKFIPHPATWLNAERWLDEAANLVPISKRPEDIQAGRLETYRASGYWGSDWGPRPTSEGVAAQ